MISRRHFLQHSAAAAATAGAGLALPTALLSRAAAATTDGPDIHGGATAAAIPPGPFAPNWESIEQSYKSPKWFQDARFGIFLHWGLYAVPAYHNEWYCRHMYGPFAQWHTEHYGPPDKFGYKDFIPMFRAEKYDPDAWATLFKNAGAKYVIPCGEHHDGFAMWDSSLTKWCAGKMGPKRDLIGDLATAVKKQGLIFGVSSHRMEHHDFMYPTTKMKTDLFDPQYADFYGPPSQGNMDDGNASPAFQEDWLARCQELIDKYQPQMLWFDAGVGPREYDAVKVRLAAYYLNRGAQWGKDVTFSTKGGFRAGSVLDFEKHGRGPKAIRLGDWQIDDQIATNSWGYINDIKYRTAESILSELVDTNSKGGNLLLNLSPKADGTIPDEQQRILLTVGKWLAANGEAIYGSRPWTTFAETAPPPGGVGGKPVNYRFSAKDGALYAMALDWPGTQAVLPSLGTGHAEKKTVGSVSLLGAGGSLKFTQDADGLKVMLPATAPSEYVNTLKIVFA